MEFCYRRCDNKHNRRAQGLAFVALVSEGYLISSGTFIPLIISLEI